MLNPASDEQDEKPLDPEVARVQQRLQRLMLISGLTLGLGIVAVFLAIIYRISAMDDKAPEPAAPAAAVPPATIAAPAPVVASTPPAPAAASAPATLPPPAAAPVVPPALPAPAAASSLSDEEKKAVLKEAKATVPADARLMSSTVAGDRIVLTYEHFAGTVVLIFDPETLAMVGRLEIKPTP
jgi:type IV secretory pathway VirB10-like protein